MSGTGVRRASRVLNYPYSRNGEANCRGESRKLQEARQSCRQQTTLVHQYPMNLLAISREGDPP